MSNQEPCCEFCLPEYSYIYDKEYSVYQSCFPTGCRFCDDGFDYCDEPPGNSDCCGSRRPCISCYTCLSPIGLAIDFITLPFRSLCCIYIQCDTYVCNKCKKEAIAI
jgi:hypothetical protein